MYSTFLIEVEHRSLGRCLRTLELHVHIDCGEIGSEAGMKVGCIRTRCCNGERNDKNVEHIWTKSDVA